MKSFFRSLHLYSLGYSAFWSRNPNPFPLGTKDHDSWNRGFFSAFETNTPIIKD